VKPNPIRPGWRAVAIVFALAAVGPTGATAQVGATVRAATLFESYSFDDGLGYSSLSEFSTPVVIDFDLGDRYDFLVSSGFARVSAESENGGRDISVSGPLDTEARLTVELLPSRLSLLVTGTIPTGTTEVDTNAGAALGLIASEVLDFSIVRLGSGGGIGAGLVGAIPVGNFALGAAASIGTGTEYTPVEGGLDYRPGSELRFRLGVEGPVGRTSYLRLAAVTSRRSEVELGGEVQGEPGLETSLYATLQQGLGASTLSVYAFGSMRSEPIIEPSALGIVVLPEARIFVTGARWTLNVRDRDRLMPRVEFRLSDAVPPPAGGFTGTSGDFQRLGTTLRLGADYRLRATPDVSVVFQADGLTGQIGTLGSSGTLPDVSGFRGGIQLEWRR